MEYLRQTVDSNTLAPIFNLPDGLRNRPADNNKRKEKSGRKSMKGCLRKYANPSLIPEESGAWSRAVEDKYANH